MAESSLPTIRLEFESVESLRAYLASDLRKGRAFVAGAGGVGERDLCELLLVHPSTGATLALVADAVWIKCEEPGAGIGVQLHDFNATVLDAIECFAAGVVQPELPDPEGPAPGSEPPPSSPPIEEYASLQRDRRPRNLHERVRRLNSRDREAMARQGTLPERVALERCYGSAVWEALLHNQNLTPPEVSRIARNGTLPRPIVALIVSNAGWISIPEVQRALLSNPRLGGQHLERVLRAMRPSDLARVGQQSNYSAPVRQAAKRLMRK